MQVVLHIGPHKTGTSTIQSLLHEHAQALADQGIHYPDPGGGQYNHHRIVHGLQSPALTEATLSEVRQMIAAADALGGRACVFSSEMFVQHPTPIQRLKDALRGFDVRVLAYIRRPDQQWISAYAQLLREPDVRRVQAVDEAPMPYDCGYSSVFGEWMASFPPGQMILAPFDPQQWAEGDLFRDFLGMIGVRSTDFIRRGSTSVRRNQSLPATLLEALRVTNATAALPRETHERLVESLETLAREFPNAFGSPPRLPTPDLVRLSFAMLERHLETYRPYFRTGFDESFLRWQGLASL